MRFFDVGERASGRIIGHRIDVGSVRSVVIGGVCRVKIGRVNIGDMEIGSVGGGRGIERSKRCIGTGIRTSNVGTEEVRETLTVCFLT